MRDQRDREADTYGEVCGMREEDRPVAINPLVEAGHGSLGGLCGEVRGNVAQTEHLQIGEKSSLGIF